MHFNDLYPHLRAIFPHIKEMEVCYKFESLRHVKPYSHGVSSIQLPKHDPNKDDISRHATTDKGKLMRYQPEIKNYWQLRDVIPGKIVFFRDEHTGSLSNTKLSPLMKYILRSSYILSTVWAGGN